MSEHDFSMSPDLMVPAIPSSSPLPEGSLHVVSLDIDAQGIARRPDGKVVFIEGALPFEWVSVQVHRQKKQLGAGDGYPNPSRVLTARAPGLPALWFACRRLRGLQDATPGGFSPGGRQTTCP